MRAAVCRAFGEPLVIEDLTVDPPGPGEISVRLAATAICHSDIHMIAGDWDWAGDPPLVAGHECSGVVEAVGAGVDSVRPGDRVAMSLIRSCGRCRQCGRGRTFLCDTSFPIDEAGRLRDASGAPVRPGLRVGGFAELAVVHASQVVRVPDGIPLDRAALLACGVITGFGAVVNTARVEPLSSVVVIGVGGVGLSAVQGARLSGANPIVAVDVLDPKLDVARRFGSTHGVNAADEDVRARVEEIAGGADFVFVTVGDERAAEQGFAMLGAGGTLVVVGIPRSGSTLSVTIDPLVDGRRVLGSNMGSTNVAADIPRLAELYLAGRLLLDEMISGRYALEDVNEAIEEVRTGRVIRNVIVF